jgi:hypothetical protein
MMNLDTLIVGLLMLSAWPIYAEDVAPTAKDSVESVRAYIAAAPKATTKTDLSYAIKIPEKERREAVERCNKVIATDPKSVAAAQLRWELTYGEGRLETVASYRKRDEGGEKEDAMIRSVLGTNLIKSASAHLRGVSLAVFQSHAARARRLLAEVIIAEHLDITLIKPTKDGDGWVKVTPAEALKETD